MIAHDLESLLGRLLKWLAAAIGVSLVLLLLLNIFGPSVKGARPDRAIMDVEDLMEAADDFGERRITTVDFVDRPLFRPDRRPPPDSASTAVTAKPEAAPEDGGVVESLDGVIATGVFASGDISGVFLKAEAGERSRVQVGEDYEGWVLASVDATGANFVAGDKRARVNLVLKFNPVLLAESAAPVVYVGSSDSRASNGEMSESGVDGRPESINKGEDNADAPRQAPTFDSIMQSGMPARKTQGRRRRE